VGTTVGCGSHQGGQDAKSCAGTRSFHDLSGVKAGISEGERPFMTYQPEKHQNTVLVNAATKGSAAPVGRDKITEDFVQTEATKFFARVASETA
jgi:hypothetical protein